MAQRTEDWLDDHVAQCPDRRHHLVGLLADDRFWSRQAGIVQQRRGVELVDAPLDRARRVHDRHAAILDPMEGVHPINDLFQGPARDNPGQDRVGVKEGDALAREGCQGGLKNHLPQTS